VKHNKRIISGKKTHVNFNKQIIMENVIILILNLQPSLRYKGGSGPRNVMGFKHTFTNVKKWVPNGCPSLRLESYNVLSLWIKSVDNKWCLDWGVFFFLKILKGKYLKWDWIFHLEIWSSSYGQKRDY